MLIYFSYFILISLSLQSGITSFYSSANIYNSIVSYHHETKDFMEIGLTAEMPKDKKIKKNYPSAYSNNGAIMFGLSYNHRCRQWNSVKESGSIPAELWATTARKWFWSPQTAARTDEP